MPKIDVRKGMPRRELDQAAFDRRFLFRFKNADSSLLRSELAAGAAAAWQAYAARPQVVDCPQGGARLRRSGLR
jgi:hypothetical protein